MLFRLNDNGKNLLKYIHFKNKMMKNNILFLICMLLCPLGKTFARVETPEWQSQYAIGLNKLAPHAYVLYELERHMEIQLGTESR